MMKLGEKEWLDLGAKLGYGLAAPVDYIRDRETLDKALAEAKAGEVLHLEGSFGALNLRGDRPITIQGGVFDKITMTGVSGLTLDGVTCNGGLEARFGQNNTITRCIIDGQKGAIAFGLVIRDMKNSAATLNLIMDHWEDDVRIWGGCDGILFEDNAIINSQPTLERDGVKIKAHCDMLQMAGVENQGIPKNITIRRNWLEAKDIGSYPPVAGRQPVPKNGRQGILVKDPNRGEAYLWFHDILIEQNIINANNINTLVSFEGDETFVMRDNTLLGAGSLRVNPKTRTERNLLRSFYNGPHPNSHGDVIYFGGDMPGGVGAVDLFAHLQAGNPHGLDLYKGAHDAG